jgi:hypothetical protein
MSRISAKVIFWGRSVIPQPGVVVPSEEEQAADKAEREDKGKERRCMRGDHPITLCRAMRAAKTSAVTPAKVTTR